MIRSSRCAALGFLAPGLVGIFVGGVFLLQFLAAFDGDIRALARFGENDSVTVEYAMEHLGSDVPLSDSLGHDGKFFFIQAMDPFVLEPSEHAAVLDRPVYRSQRMLFPFLASLGGLLGGSPIGIIWGMAIVNVLAVGLGTLFTAGLATELGLSRWWGLLFFLNPAVRMEFNVAGAGILALAFAMGAMWMAVRGRFGSTIAMLVAAVMAREVMLLVAAGLALSALRGESRRRSLSLVLIPLVAVGLWRAYLSLRLEAVASRVEEFSLPFQGFFESLEFWIQNSRALDLTVGLVILAIASIVIWRAFSEPSVLNVVGALFGVLVFLLSRQVWVNYFDITRAAGPLVTLYLLDVVARIRHGVIPERIAFAGS